ncbi:M23 family metallopeptidase [Clavibacter phaseoli]|uniref:M23 family metallopeptidase n=1 Tax=Clavibacter phaseoli TaxID=1734031 RepID=UPI001F392708|nr:M23 family metallopeptidase [Clavibacter phaseoli]UKF32445.1 M23 family metallopeptidase [Clavibacter phaseoli]UKF38534.1 M23 family metallopeptidase [Clavibacter phaseoli]
MLAAGALAVTYGLPAYAVPHETVGAAIVMQEPAAGEVQALQVEGATTSVITESAFTSIAPPPPPPPPPVAPVKAAGGATGAASSLVLGGVAASGQVLWPVPSSMRISSGFGPRISPCSGCSSQHMGLDFDPGNGAAIQAVADGVVRRVVSSNSGLGVHVVIEHQIDGTSITSTYAHMQFGSVPLTVGQAVTAGDPVGRVGTTGASTGPHLHFEIAVGATRVDPYAWLVRNVR